MRSVKQPVVTSLIISTYNRPDALRLCLESIGRQTQMPSEVVVADDGSEDSTARLIESFSKSFPVAIRHIWHEDKGFRLAAIRNRAIAAAKGDYIIQIDGDVVLHPAFIEDHLAVCRRGCYVKGSRIRLNPEFTQKVTDGGSFPKIYPWSAGILKDREKSVRLGLPGKLLTRHYKPNRSSAIGCNMAFWKSDFIKVNGYDEHFEGWGCEDNDLSRRFDALGLKNFKLFRIGLVYHLWHREADKSNYDRARDYMASRPEGEYSCIKGINQYLDDGK